MAYSTATRSLRDGSLTLKDGSATPKTVSSVCMDGDLTWTIKQNHTPDECRGVNVGWRKGKKEPCEFSFTLKAAQLAQKTIASGDPACAYELLTNRASYFTTTSSGSGGVFTIDMVFTIASPEGTSDETVTFEDCVLDTIVYAEGDMNTIKVTGRALAEMPTVARV